MRSNGRPHQIRERILRPAKDANGYLRVGLSLNKKNTTYKVHRLVADAFCDKYISKNEVNHINGIKTDNNSVNLEWCDRSENIKHAFKTGLATPMRGENNPTAKITDMQALTIKTLLTSGKKLIRISEDMKISYDIIKDINRGKTWKHL
jgi:hypothetical protein